jgi:A/G-specific adenine glycosylase
MNFSKNLINWYAQNKRDLPWRQTTDPYKIWLSEIILQQTRVDQGMSYYHKFVDHYPTANDLANAPEDNVLRDWQGLGYYSRARNLHASAKVIRDIYNGQFPNTYDEILGLKGVGSYTAAAISSFAYGYVKPVVDGNVMRVLSRIFGVTDPIDSKEGISQINQIAADLIETKDPATYNQAIMEFGAIQCTPKKPNCATCPFKSECYALKNNVIDSLPIKKGKTKVSQVYLNYALVQFGDSYYFKKRDDSGIWKGLYDFPLLESPQKIEDHVVIKELFTSFALPEGSVFEKKSSEITHLLSHRRLSVCFFHIKLENKWENPPEGVFAMNFDDCSKKGLPRVIEKYLKDINWYE